MCHCNKLAIAIGDTAPERVYRHGYLRPTDAVCRVSGGGVAIFHRDELAIAIGDAVPFPACRHDTHATAAGQHDAVGRQVFYFAAQVLDRLAESVDPFLRGVDLLHQVVVPVLRTQPHVGPLGRDNLAVLPVFGQVGRQGRVNRIGCHLLSLLPKRE